MQPCGNMLEKLRCLFPSVELQFYGLYGGARCFLLGPPEEKNLFEAGPIKNLYKKTPWRVMKSLDLLYSKFFCYLHANVEVSLNGMRVEIPHMYKV